MTEEDIQRWVSQGRFDILQYCSGWDKRYVEEEPTGNLNLGARYTILNPRFAGITFVTQEICEKSLKSPFTRTLENTGGEGVFVDP